MKTKRHLFAHKFKSGNVATLTARIPPRGQAVRFGVAWARSPGPDDAREFPHWEAHVARTLSKLAGWKIEAQPPAPLRATQTTVAR